MTGDQNNVDIWDGIEFEVHEPKDNMPLPIIDSIFQQDGYQSDVISEYGDELKPNDLYLTIPVPEPWIQVMNSPAMSVMSAELNSPVLPFSIGPPELPIDNPLPSPVLPLDSVLFEQPQNFSLEDFISYQTWYQPDPTLFQSEQPIEFQSNQTLEHFFQQQNNSSQFDLESLGFQQSLPGSVDTSQQIGSEQLGSFGYQQSRSGSVDHSHQISAQISDSQQYLAPVSKDNSNERRPSKGQNILPDGKFWNLIKSNESVLFACPWEGCAFTRPFNLKGHYNGHLGIKEYPCEFPQCTKVFRRKADRKRHEKSHYGEKNYICEACGKPFARKDALDRHLNPGTKESACKLRIELNRLQSEKSAGGDEERPVKRTRVE